MPKMKYETEYTGPKKMAKFSKNAKKSKKPRALRDRRSVIDKAVEDAQTTDSNNK